MKQSVFPINKPYQELAEDTYSDTTQVIPPQEALEISSPSTSSVPTKNARCVYMIALIFSVFCTFSVFEVNMQSSRISSDLVNPLTKPPAKRAIFFISDGNKADTMFGLYPDKEPIAPFIRSIIQEQGSYGVSYTALPTESKICTTSMLSGYYLDLPDLVNLYFFGRALSDHILNESNYAWSFGQPEIIGLFESTGENHDTVTITPVDEKLNMSKKCPQNFRAVEQLQELFTKAETDKDLAEKLRGDKVIILVHLICVDMVGHLYKPFSANYYEQVTITDSLIKEATDMVNSYYNDDKTSFFVTADHGMKYTGVHADDSLDNVRTPFVAWGAGISGPSIKENSLKSHDDYSLPWDLVSFERKDIRQVDIAPLVSSVLGNPIPANSEGVVPLNYLEEDKPWFRAEKIFINAKQICSSYIKREENWVANSILSMFSKQMSLSIKLKYNEIHGQLNEKDYEGAEKSSQALINKCLAGISEYKDSEKSGLLIIFSLTFVAWMAYGFVTALVISETQLQRIRSSIYPYIAWIVISAMLLIFLWLKNSPWRYYVYSVLPIFFGYQVATNFMKAKEMVSKISPQTIFWAVLLILVAPLMASAFKGEKYILMYAVIVWGLVMAFENYPGKKNFLIWMASLSTLAYVLSFDKIEVPEVDIFVHGWIALTAINLLGAFYFRREAFKSLFTIALMTLGSGYLSLRADSPTIEEIENWLSFWHDIAKISLLVALGYPFVFKHLYKPKLSLFLYQIFASFSPLLIFQSISYECFFYIAFVATLSSWITLERSKIKTTKASIQRNAILILIGFQILYQISYYGIGNHATIDSFKLEAGYRLLDGFNVPRLGLLMILKFSIPFFILSLYFQAMMKQNFPEKKSLNVVLFAVSTCAVIIFNYFDTSQGDIYHPKLTISYPILTACILSANVAVSGYAKLLLDKIEIENDDKALLMSKM